MANPGRPKKTEAEENLYSTRDMQIAALLQGLSVPLQAINRVGQKVRVIDKVIRQVDVKEYVFAVSKEKAERLIQEAKQKGLLRA